MVKRKNKNSADADDELQFLHWQRENAEKAQVEVEQLEKQAELARLESEIRKAEKERLLEEADKNSKLREKKRKQLEKEEKEDRERVATQTKEIERQQKKAEKEKKERVSSLQKQMSNFTSDSIKQGRKASNPRTASIKQAEERLSKLENDTHKARGNLDRMKKVEEKNLARHKDKSTAKQDSSSGIQTAALKQLASASALNINVDKLLLRIKGLFDDEEKNGAVIFCVRKIVEKTKQPPYMYSQKAFWNQLEEMIFTEGNEEAVSSLYSMLFFNEQEIISIADDEDEEDCDDNDDDDDEDIEIVSKYQGGHKKPSLRKPMTASVCEKKSKQYVQTLRLKNSKKTMIDNFEAGTLKQVDLDQYDKDFQCVKAERGAITKLDTRMRRILQEAADKNEGKGSYSSPRENPFRGQHCTPEDRSYNQGHGNREAHSRSRSLPPMSQQRVVIEGSPPEPRALYTKPPEQHDTSFRGPPDLSRTHSRGSVLYDEFGNPHYG